MAEAPPVHRTQPDPSARSQALQLLVPPLVFIAQFGLVYGWVGLACAFGWGDRGWGPVGLVQAGVLLLTAGALLALWLARPRQVPPAPEQELLAYDPQERGHFMVTVTRMVGWLSLAGMVAVAAMALLARTCAIAA